MNFSRNRMFVGLVILVIAIGMLLNYLDIGRGFWTGDNIFPVILIVIGVLGLLRGSSVVWSLGFAGIGAWCIFNNYYPRIPEEIFVSGVLGIIGISFILGAFGSKRLFHPKNIDVSSMPDYFAAFSGMNVNNTSENFVSANASTAFGGIKLDMRNAKIQGEEAVIDVFAAFGGIEITVPTDWVVVTKGLPIFGGFDNKTVNNTAVIGKRLVVKGAAFFGGVNIKN